MRAVGWEGEQHNSIVLCKLEDFNRCVNYGCLTELKLAYQGLALCAQRSNAWKKVKKCRSVIIRFCVQHLQTPLVHLWWNVAWRELLGTQAMDVELQLQLILLHIMLWVHLTLQLSPYCLTPVCAITFFLNLYRSIYKDLLCAGLIFYCDIFISHDVTYNCYRTWLFIPRLKH